MAEHIGQESIVPSAKYRPLAQLVHWLEVADVQVTLDEQPPTVGQSVKSHTHK